MSSFLIEEGQVETQLVVEDLDERSRHVLFLNDTSPLLGEGFSIFLLRDEALIVDISTGDEICVPFASKVVINSVALFLYEPN